MIQDFAMNTLCAAGTGSFLDQQAHRLGLTIEEFSATGPEVRKSLPGSPDAVRSLPKPT